MKSDRVLICLLVAALGKPPAAVSMSRVPDVAQIIQAGGVAVRPVGTCGEDPKLVVFAKDVSAWACMPAWQFAWIARRFPRCTFRYVSETRIFVVRHKWRVVAVVMSMQLNSSIQLHIAVKFKVEVNN